MNGHYKNSNKEKELIDTSSFFDLWFENSRLFAQLLLDENGTIIKCSSGVKTYYGYTPEDLFGKKLSVLFTEEDRTKGKPESELNEVIEKGSVFIFHNILHKDGFTVWSHGEMISIKGKHGERYFIKTLYDIDQQKILEEFLIASEERQSLLSGMFDSFISGIEVFKSIRNKDNEIIDFEYMLVNKAAEMVMRRSRHELIGKRLLEVYPELKRIGIIELQKRVVETGKPENAEFFYDKQGLSNWLKAAFVKFGDGLIVTFEDITAEKSASSELEKTTIFLLESQKLSHVSNFEWDIVNDIITGTPELCQLFRFENDSPGLYDFLRRVYPEDRERVQSAFMEAIHLKTPYEIDYRITLPDGSVKSLFASVKIVFDNNERPVKIIGTVVDVTNIKQVESNLKTAEDKLSKVNLEQEKKVSERIEELLTANEQLKKVIEELDKYAYIVSHDLRSPLNAMEGLIFLLGEDYKNKPLNTEGEVMLDMINVKIQNMKELISQVLKSAKADFKIREPVNLYELVKEVIQTLNPPSHFQISIEHNLPHVKYHKTSLIQIFQNLIDNAIKYMDKEQPKIAIGSKEYEKEHEIRIYDNGCGIPETKLNIIFNMFEVGHENENIESHGLGLSIVKKLVEENGGRVRVESKEGVETNFYFTIPKI